MKLSIAQLDLKLVLNLLTHLSKSKQTTLVHSVTLRKVKQLLFTICRSRRYLPSSWWYCAGLLKLGSGTKKMKTKKFGFLVLTGDQKAEGEYTSKDGKNLTLYWLPSLKKVGESVKI